MTPILKTVKSTVIMVGWVGCNASQLSKYAAVYERAGATVLQYRFYPDSLTFVESLRRKSVHQQFVEDIARGVAREVTGPSPIFFHGYSNGGCVPYAFLLQSLYGNDRSASTKDDTVARGLLHLRQHLAGVVIDSGPIRMNVKAVSLLFMFIPSKPTILERLSYVAICTRTYLRFHFSQMKSFFPYKYLNSRDFYHLLQEQTMTFSRGIPELYISSDKDVLLKTSFSDWMAKFVARRRAIASNQQRFPPGSGLVEAHRYATGNHVSLLLAHPADYQRLCASFLSRCVELHKARLQLDGDTAQASITNTN